MMNIELFAFVGLVIVGDVVSGIVKGLATSTLSSRIMKEGLWKKLGTVMLVLVSFTVTLLTANVPEIGVPCDAVFTGTCAYVLVMELTSILENVCEINPELPLAKILEIFKLNKGDD